VKRLLLSGLFLSSLSCASAASRPSRPEEGERRLESLGQLRAAFNEHPERRRILALASPS